MMTGDKLPDADVGEVMNIAVSGWRMVLLIVLLLILELIPNDDDRSQEDGDAMGVLVLQF
jgi:hypothetical protein